MPVPAVDKWAKLVGRGMVAQFAPDLVRSALVQLFQEREVSVQEAIEWVEHDHCLWGCMKPQHQNEVRKAARILGKVDWLTADWAIKALRKDLPALASLFLGWDEGKEWLERQITMIKEQARS